MLGWILWNSTVFLVVFVEFQFCCFWGKLNLQFWGLGSAHSDESKDIELRGSSWISASSFFVEKDLRDHRVHSFVWCISCCISMFESVGRRHSDNLRRHIRWGGVHQPAKLHMLCVEPNEICLLVPREEAMSSCAVSRDMYFRACSTGPIWTYTKYTYCHCGIQLSSLIQSHLGFRSSFLTPIIECFWHHVGWCFAEPNALGLIRALQMDWPWWLCTRQFRIAVTGSELGKL